MIKSKILEPIKDREISIDASCPFTHFDLIPCFVYSLYNLFLKCATIVGGSITHVQVLGGMQSLAASAKQDNSPFMSANCVFMCLKVPFQANLEVVATKYCSGSVPRMSPIICLCRPY